jgi:hypothetical protein
VRRFWRPAALPGAHSCEERVARIEERDKRSLAPRRSILASSLLLQLRVPVHVADELWPAFESDVVVGVDRLPRRPDRLAAERHAGLARRAVGLALVASDAGEHAVRPVGDAAVGARHDVVDRELARARLLAAILAHVAVALENVATAECNGRLRLAVVARQRDDFRHAQSRADRLHEGFAVARAQSRPVAPRERLVVGDVDDAGCVVPNEHECARDRGDVYRLPVAVEHKCRALEDVCVHWSLIVSPTHSEAAKLST